MYEDINGGNELAKLRRRVKVLETVLLLNSASVSNGQTRFNGEQAFLLDGSGTVTGELDVEGLLKIIGELLMDGTLNGSGTGNWSGPWNQTGDIQITGHTSLDGDVDVTGDFSISGNGDLTGTLTVDGGGSIVIEGSIGAVLNDGSIIWDSGGFIQGASGGVQVGSGGSASLTLASSIGSISATIFTFSGDVVVGGDFVVSGVKSFRMIHPLDPSKYLTHASTESPVSGVEYWGEVTLDGGGSATVALPSYFEALTKPSRRVVLVTGNGFAAGWSSIVDGEFTVTGIPGGAVSWLVKAERIGADFTVESAIPT